MRKDQRAFENLNFSVKQNSSDRYTSHYRHLTWEGELGRWVVRVKVAANKKSVGPDTHNGGRPRDFQSTPHSAYNVASLMLKNRAIVQAVSRWLPTAAARVWSCEICGGQSGAGAGFLRVLRFPLPILHSTNCSTIILIYHLGFVQ
jgi:hypothetical protein